MLPAKRTYLILLGATAFASLCIHRSGFSQTQTGSSLTAAIGIIFHSEVNDLVSPMEYSGSALPMQIGYSHRTLDRVHQLSLNFYTANLENSISTHRDILFLELSYRLSLPVTTFTLLGQNVKLQAGPGLWNRAVKNEQLIHTPFITVNRNNNGYVFSSLSGHLTLETLLGGRNALAYSVETPLLLYTLTRHYSGVDMEQKLQPGYRVILLTHRLQYRLNISEALDLVTALRYEMNRFNTPTFYGAVHKGLTVGITWRL